MIRRLACLLAALSILATLLSACGSSSQSAALADGAASADPTAETPDQRGALCILCDDERYLFLAKSGIFSRGEGRVVRIVETKGSITSGTVTIRNCDDTEQTIQRENNKYVAIDDAYQKGLIRKGSKEDCYPRNNEPPDQKLARCELCDNYRYLFFKKPGSRNREEASVVRIVKKTSGAVTMRNCDNTEVTIPKSLNSDQYVPVTTAYKVGLLQKGSKEDCYPRQN